MSQDKFTHIGEYIVQKRTEKGLSQEAFCNELQQYNSLFNEIDSLTISRWERGKVSPNIRRQIAIMEYFDDLPHLILADPDFEVKQLPSLTAFQKMLDKETNFNHIMGAHPYFSRLNIGFDKLNKTTTQLRQFLKWVSYYHANLTNQREILTVDHLLTLLSFSSSQADFYQAENTLVGHSIKIRVAAKTYNSLLLGNIKEADLTSKHLITNKQPGYTYMLSGYVGGRHIAEDFLTQTLYDIIKTPNTLGLGYRAHSDIGIKVMDFLAGKVQAKGVSISGRNDGAKYRGKRYTFVAFSIDREDILASPIMLNLMRSK